VSMRSLAEAVVPLACRAGLRIHPKSIAYLRGPHGWCDPVTRIKSMLAGNNLLHNRSSEITFAAV